MGFLDLVDEVVGLGATGIFGACDLVQVVMVGGGASLEGVVAAHHLQPLLSMVQVLDQFLN